RHGLAGRQGSHSHPWHGTGAAWQGPRAAPRPSPPSLGGGSRGGPGAGAAQPAVGTGPTSLPAAGKGSALPDPTATSRVTSSEVTSSEVTSPGPGGALGSTVGLLGPPDTEGPPEHSPVPLEQSWHPPAVPGQPPASVSAGSSAAAQSRGSPPSTGSPHIPLSPQPAPASSSAAPTSPTPEPSLGTSRGVRGLNPTVGTPPAGLSPGHPLPRDSSGGGPADGPQIPGGTPMGVGDAGPWAVTATLGWQPGSLAPSPAPGPPQQPAPSQPASSLGPSTTTGITATAVTATSTIAAPTSTIAAPTSTIAAPTSTITAAAASPSLLEDAGTVTLVPSAAVLQGNVPGLTWGPLTTVPGPPQQPTHPPGTLGHGGGSGSPRASGDTDVVQPSSGPGGRPDGDPPRATLAPAAAGRAPRVFIVEDQPPLLRASLLRIPCELVLDMGFIPALQDPTSREHRGLLLSFNQTVTPLFMSVPGFLRLEVTGIRWGSVVLEYDALFTAERPPAAPGARPGPVAGWARAWLGGEGVAQLDPTSADRPLDPCALLFACRAGFVCVAGTDGNATCTSLCHRDYCKNHGICTHAPDRGPLCQCPVGSDFWFMGLRCDYRVTQQSLLGMAAGVLLSIVLLGAVIAAVAIRRFKALLLEARADQTRSSYRRFCRLDDVSAQYWSRSWLPSASSLDNPAFSNSEELLHLQILDNGCCSCQEDSGITEGAKQRPALPARPPCRPSFHYDWDTSSSSMNDPMVDSGKASDISVSSWPMEPLQWTPFPLLHQLSRQRPHKARRPHSYCEGMELVNLERSWTA
ncbi:IMPG2 protein, partial [Eurystomus gularis]|nr:IMPG2 protein [Eurystomus gularis]